MKYKSRIDAYGEISKQENNPTILNGRYVFQSDSELLIPDDIKKKLILERSDDVLDIGCGSGNIAIQISKEVNSISVCDHPNLIKRLKRINKRKNFKYIPQVF